MSLFRVVKYSSLLFFLGKYKHKLFRIIAVLLFALVTSLLYQDVADYLQREYPGTVIYALVAKIVIVYGALVFVLLQFRPSPEATKTPPVPATEEAVDKEVAAPADRLAALADVEAKDKLRSRYDRILDRNE